MGKAVVATGSIMLLMTILVHGVSAQPAPAPAPATTDCYTSLLGLSDCLTYVEEGSNLTKPDKPCCPELAGLVKDNPVCLCYLLGNTSSSLGFQIDTNRALKLPTVCKVDTPPASTCAVLGIPVSAPIASEGPNSPAQPAPAPAPATTDCYTSLLGLSDCLTYVEEGSNLTKPDKPCCPELAGLVKENPICLCDLLGNTSSSLGIQIDINRALKLPTVCKVDTPPASTCAVLGIPVPAPIASEGPNSPDFAESPQGPAAAAGSPEANKDKNGASRTADSVIALLGGLAIAILPAFF